MQIYKLLISIVLISFFLYSCNNTFTEKKIDEGKIIFDIEYLDDEEDNYLIALLPSTMTLKFKDNNTISKIEGFFGAFRLVYISNLKEGKNYSLLRVMDQKYMYKADTVEQPFGYNQMLDISFKYLDDTTSIAGYFCNIAEAYCPAISDKPLMLYYTHDIDIASPNTNTPFKEIQGVLLGFQVRLSGINMKFIANEVVPEEIADEEFLIPDGYKIVSKKELEKVINSFNQNK